VGEASPPLIVKVRLAGLTAAALLLALVLGLILQGVVLPKVIIHFVESALELQVSGPVQPLWGRFEFSVNPVKTLWDQKIQIDSGRVDVRYEVQDVFLRQIHIVVRGQEIDAQLLGDWVTVAGGQSAVFKDLYADLIIDQSGIKEIKALRAESPALQFRFGEASNRHLKETHEA
jgi:hypothetical protein